MFRSLYLVKKYLHGIWQQVKDLQSVNFVSTLFTVVVQKHLSIRCHSDLIKMQIILITITLQHHLVYSIEWFIPALELHFLNIIFYDSLKLLTVTEWVENLPETDKKLQQHIVCAMKSSNDLLIYWRLELEKALSETNKLD
ncbi:CLUMA_CG003955, isoform A [Clunio marinus]|uniref:CLUMA_CG003955, isoform A n=1 Tax=Clunio marinus TaxID=568069 RepID=A0A1J1HS82_9DIPT|nr:CLUMA_CG003955, isoform A [Clunio marinus]